MSVFRKHKKVSFCLQNHSKLNLHNIRLLWIYAQWINLRRPYYKRWSKKTKSALNKNYCDIPIFSTSPLEEVIAAVITILFNEVAASYITLLACSTILPILLIISSNYSWVDFMSKLQTKTNSKRTYRKRIHFHFLLENPNLSIIY